MRKTLLLARGVGLAAVQIGVSRQLFIYHWQDEGGVLRQGVAINPILEFPDQGGEDLQEEPESCLSFPGPRYPLARARAVRLTAKDVNGQAYTLETGGWLARIFQHEYDHLQGILYVDRLEKNYRKKAYRHALRSGWNRPGLVWTPGVDKIEA